MLCRKEALNIIANSGESEGAVAWYRLLKRFDAASKTHTVATLTALLSFDFSGSVTGRLEEFNRAITKYEQRSGETISDDLRMGIVVNRPEDRDLRKHLLMNMARYASWAAFQEEVVAIRRTQQGPVAMDIGALPATGYDAEYVDALQKGGGKGAGKGKDPRVCHNCGKPGHVKAQCRKPGGGASGQNG